MSCTKNVSEIGGGDDKDPPCPFRQVKGKTVYFEQQEGRKKRRLDGAARAALAAATAAEQAERGDQLRISSDQIAYRVRRLDSRPRSSAPTTPTTATTPPPTLPAPVTPAPSTTSAIPTTSTTPTSTDPPPAPLSAPPIPPARFRERDETEVQPLATDPRLFDLQHATATQVHRFRHVPVETWLPAQRDRDVNGTNNICSYPCPKRANNDLDIFSGYSNVFFQISDMDSDTCFRYRIRIQYRLYPSDIKYLTRVSNISE
jgi:hypothetical protein